MTQLYLAFSHENAPLAEQLADRLPGIDCIQHSDLSPDAGNGGFNSVLQETQHPVLLLVTDNFLKNETCMSGALGMMLSLMRQSRILPVVANGVVIENGEERQVETHIDRVINAIQYMNYWQQQYLALSDQFNHTDEDGKAALNSRLQAVHSIADQTGELISALRDADFSKWENLEQTDFADVYRKLNIPQPEPGAEPEAPEMPQPAPQEAPFTSFQPTSGISDHAEDTHDHKTAIPVAGPVMFQPAPPVAGPVVIDPPVAIHNEHITEPSKEEQRLPDPGEYREQEIQQTISDAWGWIERGNAELGIEVLKLAAEQYPDHQQLREEYEKALNAGIAVEEVTDFEQEAHSYEAAGDSAFNDGDYLMAKYCWDRASESNPELPGIWKKLGLLTSDQLTGYTETSIIYLKKAYTRDPMDAQVVERLIALGETGLVTLDTQTSTTELTVETSPVHEINDAAPVIIPEQQPATTVAEQPEMPATEEPTAIVQETTPAYVPEPQPVTVAQPVQHPGIVLITGATSGIGKATAIEFARHGYRLIITGRRAELLYELSNYINSVFRTDVLPLVFDVRDQRAVDAALSYLPEGWTDVDILINNAGLAKGLSPIHEGSLVHWETMIDTNIKGVLYVTRIISQGMVKRRKGHIVNISSSAGKEAYPNGNVYSATKFAIEALTKSIRLDLHKHNIRVSQVSPGHVEETEFAITRFDGDAQRARIYDDFQPLKASDVAEAIWFMASRPAHVNIQDIYIFGTQQASATVVDRSGR